ncbi:Zn-dependent M28 family amino/carboxypeptidase [Litorimonas taeanensis]|uniref:Zn-dependent M28 family amino/carboxypeptidase n=1 Tax=Litorimonas taeanensis TaxID=568099 RepID=A0A420WJW5_9PROT|nr:M28 family metallopeptidase [Litorimonas taeanensis]RKQ71321.1 Zn-dependent M28 family amino/carboxypeptidase [Litorimonas taeanensis]
MSPIKLLATVSLTAMLFTACSSEPTTPTLGDTSISAADLGRRIERLASDEFEGRAPGTPGGQAASQYIADEMALAGLSPAGDSGTYFQNVELTEATVNAGSFMNIHKASDDSNILEADLKTNAVYWTKRLDKTVNVTESELVFVGYGITAPEYGWNDYEGLDVKGKTVVILVNDPGFATKDEALFKGNAMTYYGRWTYKYEEAARQGAAGAIIVHETAPASYGWDVVAGSWTGAQYDLVRPDRGASRAALEGWVHLDAAKQLFEAAGLDYGQLKNQAVTKDFKPVPMGELRLNAKIEQTVQTTTSRNVAGEIKGAVRPDEYVLYMAHWDHLGKNDNLEGDDKIYNGAVDNATGTAAIIEIGEAMAQGAKPERSVIFVAVTAEESGLLGSAYYGDAPLVPLKNTVAGVNIDAILPLGKTKDVKVMGFGASELEDRLKTVLDERDMYIVPDDKPEAGYYYRSDHISLAKKGVPMLYADLGNDHFMNGLTYGEDFANGYTKERYHKPGDEYDNSWDLTGIKQVTEIFYDLGLNIANSEDWPNWYEGTEFRSLRDDMLKD